MPHKTDASEPLDQAPLSTDVPLAASPSGPTAPEGREPIDVSELQSHALEPGEELDPLAEYSTSNQGSILKPILMIAVVVLLGSLIGDYTEEIRYYFQPDTPIEIGVVHDYPSLRAHDPDFEPPLTNNTYVHARGIPTQRSQSTRMVFFKLAGDDIFVESPREVQDEIEQLSETQNARETTEAIDRDYFDGSGRLLSFASLPGRYNGIRRYYTQNYGETFCETMTPEGLEEKKRRRREMIISDWTQEYKGMSDEEREKAHMGPMPTPEMLDKLMNAQPLCIKAYLIQAGKKPSDFIWYVIGVVAAVLFMALNVYWTIRWFVRFFRGA